MQPNGRAFRLHTLVWASFDSAREARDSQLQTSLLRGHDVSKTDSKDVLTQHESEQKKRAFHIEQEPYTVTWCS